MNKVEEQQKKIDSFYKTATLACIDHDYKKLGLCYYGIGTCLKKIENFRLELEAEINYVPTTPEEQGKYI